MAPTPSVYLFTGEGAVDETVWPPAGVQAPAMEGEPARPLYHFAGDNQAAEPPTTNGANVPGWELYTGPTEPVGAETPPAEVDSPASTSEPTATQQTPPEGSSPASSQPDTSAPSSEQTQRPASESAAPAEPLTAPSSAADAPAPAPSAAPAIPPAVIDGIVYRGRDDNDVLSGNFCRVVAGEHQGRYGVFVTTNTLCLDGWPATVTIKTRDDRDELIVVSYGDIRPAQPGGR